MADEIDDQEIILLVMDNFASSSTYIYSDFESCMYFKRF